MPPDRPSTMWRPARSPDDGASLDCIGRSAPACSDERVEQRLRLGAFPVELADYDVHRAAVATDDDGARKDARRPRHRRVAFAVEQDRWLEGRTIEKAADDVGRFL